jgi:hypothetical protein
MSFVGSEVWYKPNNNSDNIYIPCVVLEMNENKVKIDVAQSSKLFEKGDTLEVDINKLTNR